MPESTLRFVIQEMEKAMKEHVELSLLPGNCEGQWAVQKWLYDLQVSQEIRAPALRSRLPKLWSPAAFEAENKVDLEVDARNFNRERNADHSTLGSCTWAPLVNPHVVTDAARKLIDMWREAGLHVIFAAVEAGQGMWGGAPTLHCVWQQTASQHFKQGLCSAFLKTIG